MESKSYINWASLVAGFFMPVGHSWGTKRQEPTINHNILRVIPELRSPSSYSKTYLLFEL